MPSSTLDRPPTRAKLSDWVVLVPGQEPVAASTAICRVATAPARRLTLPTLRPVAIPAAVRRFLPTLGLVVAAVAMLASLLGRDPLLTLGLTAPHFVAYQGTSAENVRFVMDDGWSQTAAVPGALLMDWQDGRPGAALRLTMGNPAAEPEIESVAADGSKIDALRYRSVWPGIDTVIKTQPGGWSSNMIVQPGVDPSIIQLEYVGATELSVDQAGRLHVKTADGEWIDGTPETWQDGPAGREPVQSSYSLLGGTMFGFNVGSYDPSRPLVVDPPSERAS